MEKYCYYNISEQFSCQSWEQAFSYKLLLIVQSYSAGKHFVPSTSEIVGCFQLRARLWIGGNGIQVLHTGLQIIILLTCNRDVTIMANTNILQVLLGTGSNKSGNMDPPTESLW